MLLHTRRMTERSLRRGKREKGVQEMLAECPRCLHWTNKLLDTDFKAKEDRQTITDVGDEQWLHLI